MNLFKLKGGGRAARGGRNNGKDLTVVSESDEEI